MKTLIHLDAYSLIVFNLIFRAALDLSLRTILIEKKSQHEIAARKQREKDKDLRSLKRAELQAKVAEDNLSHQKMIYEKVKGSLDSAPKDDGTLLKKRMDLQKDVEQTKRALSQQVFRSYSL